MTDSEYQELIAFLGRKFEEVDRRFEEVATKEEVRAQWQCSLLEVCHVDGIHSEGIGRGRVQKVR